MLRHVTLAMSLSLVAVSPKVMAQAEDYVVDTDHTTASFEVPHLAVSTVEGKFTKLGGTLNLDPKAPEKMQLDAWVEAASVSTDNEKRDSHLKGPDFFDAAKFPKLTLKGRKITKKSAKAFVMLADLTMHGVTKPVKFDVDYKGTVTAFGKQRAAFRLSGKIVRQDFGMTFGALADAVPLVGDEVEIKVICEAIRKKDM